jgi:heme a synthase
MAGRGWMGARMVWDLQDGRVRQASHPARPAPPALKIHRFAQFVAGCTVLLILAGSLVTSHDAGLSVPDWPTSYGWNMFTFPPSMWVANIFYEHGHRLVASTVGFLTILLALWLWLTEPRPWLRWLGAGALGIIVAQGVLGGLTVLFFLPAPISIAHAALAEIFFCITVAIAVFTSPGWLRDGDTVAMRDDLAWTMTRGVQRVADDTLRRMATATTAVIYLQILVGAAMRHTGAGLAIPDFPLMFGRIAPDHWSPAIAVHFAHRAGAAIVGALAAATVAAVWLERRRRPDLVRPAAILALLVVVQVTLGALTILTRRDPLINSFHVVCGALVLATSLVIMLRGWRADGREGQRQMVLLKPDVVRLEAESTAAVAHTPIHEPRVAGVRFQPDVPVGGVRLQPDDKSCA